MKVSRDNLVARHWLADQPLSLPANSYAHAEQMSELGNYFAAGLMYSRLHDTLAAETDVVTTAKLLTRSATCFDLSGAVNASARCYSDAAQSLSSNNEHAQTAGELLSRSAGQFLLAGHYFAAGTAWMSAAKMFSKLGKTVIRSKDNIPPVPLAGAGLTVAGRCYTAAANTFLLANGTEKNWAVMAHWLAGQCYAESFPAPSIQTFDSYKSALEIGIKQYGSILPEKTRLYLPLSGELRKSKADPLQIMEGALFESHREMFDRDGSKVVNPSAKMKTDEEIAATYDEFARSLSKLGRAHEASRMRAESHRRMEGVYLKKRNLVKWMSFIAWRLTSNYGESLLRWSIFTATSIFVFALSYELTKSTQPVAGFFDNIYFSIVTFTSLGYGDIHPVGWLGKALAAIEIVTGLVAFGILLTFMSNRFNRD